MYGGSKTDSYGVRSEIIAYLHRTVVGPAAGADEVVEDPPHRRYLSGTLYPQNAETEEIVANDEADGVGGSHADELADDPVKLANEWLPSSIGLTLYVSGQGQIRCEVWGARYETFHEGRSRRWRRIALSEPALPEVEVLTAPGGRRRTATPVLEGRAELQAFWRPMPDGHLVTLTLVNIQTQGGPTPIETDLCLHQVGFACRVTDGSILEYPSVDFLSADPEEAELRLLHRHVKTFAIGHGCAANWQATDSGQVEWVWTDLIPTFEVAPVAHAGDFGHEALELRYLADPTVEKTALEVSLQSFASSYGAWIDGLRSAAAQLPAVHAPATARVLERLDRTFLRIQRGIKVLVSDEKFLKAFRLANLAMLMQMRHSKEDLGGTRRRRDEIVPPAIDYWDLRYTWRPFQLAFILLTLPSVAQSDDPDRDVVDLIWFPTGGGKTEAYLGVAAFEIFLRRLRSGDSGAGTAVITRYTLRLLTAQQFQRAAALVAAAELIRRDHEDVMGRTPMSIGLWVGDEAAPNRYSKAVELFDEVLNDPEPTNPFQLETCPWCGTEIVPRVQDSADCYGIRATNTSFLFFCPSTECKFHDGLPVAVVDDELYARPPTILIATVDKFARLAWDEGGSAFFGMGGRYEVPSLIIQDELHLLSGPLGTTVGIYEGAVEALIALNGGNPKILASTATIRRAEDQVTGLFGRSVQLFPPPGLDARDSYFSRVDSSKPGRLYVGVMSQSHTAATTMINVAASLLQAPVELGLQGDELDAFWTVVAYHNSLRELGRTITQARDDIPKRLETISSDQSRRRQLDDHTVVELTSNVGGTRLPSLLARLSLHHDDADAVSFLATTNMLSVGVDVPRLGLMLVNGQPKTTSEYIQATSRVGRSRVPGLVVTMYSATRPRDRSHYETFVPYHGALYRQVEPTSVTPYSLPSRERALHAALVILVRHGAGLASNDEAGSFDPADPATRRAIEMLKDRVIAVDGDEANATSRHLDRLVEEWATLAQATLGSGRRLYYKATSRQHQGLLQDFGAGRDAGWETLHSMRNVDRQCSIRVIGEDRD
jgi:hypothetical protein